MVAAGTSHGFRFGVQANGAVDASAWRELARRTEALGYSCLTMPDHFSDQLAPVPALAVAAEATSTLRVGALVWDNDYKHPVVLAKEVATMDVLSGGRVELGIGAGWMRSDYDQSGIAYDPPGVRVDRMIEGVDVMLGCFAEGPFSFSGEHYRIADYDARPLPVQRPHPPLLIGGGGPRVLTYAASVADIVGINATLTAGAVGPEAIATMTAEAVDAKVDVVRRGAGARMAEIEMNVRAFMVQVTHDAVAASERIAGAIGVPAAMVDETPFALIGPPAKLVEDLLSRRERWGFSYVIVGAEDVESFAPVVAELAGR